MRGFSGTPKRVRCKATQAYTASCYLNQVKKFRARHSPKVNTVKKRVTWELVENINIWNTGNTETAGGNVTFTQGKFLD